MSTAESNFTGRPLEYFVKSLIAGIVSILGLFTFGLLTAWATIYLQKWVAGHTHIEGKQLKFEASFVDLWVKTIIWMLLTMVTFGFYAILGFLFVARQKYFIARTTFA